MTSRWLLDAQSIKTVLEEHGFEILSSETTPEGGGSLSARRDAGDHATVLNIDAGGRLQIRRTEVLVDEAAKPVFVDEVKLTMTERTTRQRTIRGVITSLDQLRSALAAVAETTESADLPQG